MPAWMTSELRELVCEPKVGSLSTTITSRPASASARATARPTTPAPITATSIDSAPLIALATSLERTHVLRDAARHDDVEAGLRGNAEERARRVAQPLARAVEAHTAAACRDVHTLRGVGPEM